MSETAGRRGVLGRLWAACAGLCVLAAVSGSEVHPALWPAVKPPPLVDAVTEARIAGLVGALSVEEKVGQIIQTDIGSVSPEDLREYPLGSILAGGNSGPYNDERASAATWLRLAQAFRAMSLEPRAGHEPIPVMFGIDAVHGHNNIVGAEVYPHNIGLGATHDADLVRRIGAATAEEIAVTGIDWAFAPTVAVPQDVRWGRSYEGFASDPALVAGFARAAVEGLQTPSAAGTGGRVAACAKHFLGDGGTFMGVDEGDTRVDEATLARLHGAGYAAAVEAGVLTVMASYSSWNGEKMHGATGLLTDVLKGRMGFQGLVVGDWNGHAQVEGCNKDHCPAAINAGVDLFMAPMSWKRLYAATLEDVRAGRIPMQRLDDAVTRILRVKFALGLFEHDRPLEGRFERLASPAHRALAREAVRKSLVLLKNDGSLPIRGTAKVVIAGPHPDNLLVQNGGWTLSWQGDDTRQNDFPQAQSIAAGIKQAVLAQGGKVLDEVDDLVAEKPDVAIVVFGEAPYAEMFGDVKLPLYNSRTGLRALEYYQHLGIPTVSVFLSGRPLWVNPEINASRAFVAAWLPGSEGAGIADLLIGDAQGRPRFDFSGTLPMPWPRSALLPPYASRGSTEFPVGFGLSYAHPATTPRLGEALDGR